MMKRLYSFIALTFIALSAYAQNEAMPFCRMALDAKSLAMGASILGTSDLGGAVANAAAIPFSSQSLSASATATLFQPSVSASIMPAVGVSYNLKDKLGISAGWFGNLQKAYDITDGTGKVTGQFKPADMQLHLGVAYRIIKQLSVGVNLKYLNSKLAQDASYNAFAGDVLVMGRFGGLKCAAGVMSLGTPVKSLSGAKFPLPASAKLAVAYELSLADAHRIEAEANADYYFAGSFGASVGASWSFRDYVSVRAGYHYGGKSIMPSFASLGLSGGYKGYQLHLAYLLSSGAMKNTLAAGVSVSF